MELNIEETSLADVPEALHPYFVEQDGKFKLQVKGIKTAEDVSRVQEALRKERLEHKDAKAKLAEWGDLLPEETKVALERIPELEASVGDNRKKKTDEQVEAIVKARMGVIERQLEKSTSELTAERDVTARYKQLETTRKLADAARTMAIESKALPDTFKSETSGFMLTAMSCFEVNADGEVVAREGGGLTAGLSPKEVVAEFQDQHPYFWPASSGGGANPGTGTTTKQVFRANDMEARSQLAKTNRAEFDRQFQASGLATPGSKVPVK